MKRLFALLLSGVLLATTVPSYSFAAVATDKVIAPESNIAVGEPAPGSSKTEPSTVGLETAIKTVKQKIAIPKEYSQFNYYFTNSSYSETYWSLNWSNPTTSSFIQVSCDADYNITYFYSYDYSKKNSGVSQYLKSELKATAEAFLTKIAPDTKNSLELVDTYYEGIYSGNYVYSYQRTNSGVDFPDNGASVWVNSVTGEVTSASVNWVYDEKIPLSKASITQDEAKKIVKDNMTMKLVYRSNYYGIYDKGGSGSKKAFLVYEPSQSYISIDAKSGKVYQTRTQWVETTNFNDAKKTEASSDMMMNGAVQNSLTEEEIAKIDELKDIISKDKAIKLITENSYLFIDKNLKSYTAYLSKLTNEDKTSYVWNINLNDPRAVNYETDKDYYRAYAYAQVDAKTGKILSFSASMKSYYDEKNNTWTKVKVPYNKEDSRAILEKFLKSQVKDRFNKSKLVEAYDGYIAYYKEEIPVYGGYSYQYNRVNEGIEYPYNYISGSVDGVSGKVYYFSTYWDDKIEFESAKNVISSDKAMDYYLNDKNFGLKYEVNVINKYASNGSTSEGFYDNNASYSVEKEIRLVYRPDMNPAFISPFTGEQMNYNGEIYKDVKPYTYTDITNTTENRNILLLADMNVGFEGDKFHPNQAVTVGEMNKLLQDIGLGYGYEVNNDSKAKNHITKEELASIFINKLGLEKVAKLSGIYTTGYADEYSIAPTYLGSVALAKGLGLFTADSENKFNPKMEITRVQAVDLIFKLISVQQSGLSY